MSAEPIADVGFMRLAEVQRVTALSRSGIYARMAAGTFPVACKRGATSVWVRAEVVAWCAAEAAALPRMGQSMGARQRPNKKAANSAA